MKNKSYLIFLIVFLFFIKANSTTYTIDCSTSSFTCNVGDTLNFSLSYTANITISSSLTAGAASYSTTNFIYVVAPGAYDFFIQDVNNFFNHCWTTFTTNSNSTNVKLNIAELNLKVGPNPVSNFLFIQAATIDEVILYDVSGKIVYPQKEKMKGNEVRLNLSDQESGIYFIKINSANATITNKIIIQKQ